MARKSDTKRNTKVSVSRGDDAASKYGPKVSGNIGSKVGDDRAGTRSRADLPPETKAIKAPEAKIPSGAKSLAAKTMPVPGINDKFINVVEPWDVKRDRGL